MPILRSCILAVVSALLWGCAGSFDVIDPTSPPALAFNEGTQKLREGKPEQAVKLLRDALKQRPVFPEAQINLGIALAALGQTEEAESLYRDVIRLRPQMALAHVNLGGILLSKKDYPEALVHLQEALDLNPRLPQGHALLAKLYFARRELAKAKEESSLAILIAPNDAQYYALLGSMYLSNNNLDQALTELKTAALLDPNSPQYRKLVGQALLRKGKWAEAAVEFQIALRQNPRSAETYVLLAEAAKKKQSYDEAWEFLRQAVRAEPTWPPLEQVLRSFGVTFQAQGRLDLAAATYREAIALSPGDQQNYRLLAGVYKAGANGDDEVNVWRLALIASPGNIDARKCLVEALVRNKRLDEASRELQRWIDASPNDPAVPLAQAQYLWAKGEKDASIETLRAVSKDDVYGGRALLQLGRALWDMQQFGEAVEAMKEAVRLSPEWPETHTKLAIRLTEVGEPDAAMQHVKEGLSRALQSRTEEPLALIYGDVGLVFSRTERLDEAASALREAIRLAPYPFHFHNNLAYVLLKKGDLNAALEEIQKAVATKADEAACRDTYGEILASMGQVEQAQSEFREAIRLSPTYAPAHFHLATALLQTTQMEEGYRELEEFLLIAPRLHRFEDDIAVAKKRLAERGRD